MKTKKTARVWKCIFVLSFKESQRSLSKGELFEVNIHSIQWITRRKRTEKFAIK